MSAPPRVKLPVRVLYVDHDLQGRRLVRDVLASSDEFDLVEANSMAEFNSLISIDAFDVVLSNLDVLAFTALDVIEAVADRMPGAPVVIVTDSGSEEIAVAALKRGAADYVVKTAEQIRRLPIAITTAVELAALRKAKQNAEKALEAREELYRKAIAASAASVYQRDFITNQYLYFDATIEHLLELPPGQTTPDIWRKNMRRTVFYGKLANFSLKQVDQLFRSGEIDVLAFDIECITPSGKTVWLSDTAIPVYDQQGRVTGSLGILKDITKRKQAEKKRAQQTEQRIRNQQSLLELAKENFPNQETAFHRISQKDAEQLNVKRVSIWLFNESHTEIYCQLFCDAGEIKKKALVLKYEQYPRYFQALEESGFVLADDARNDPSTSEFRDHYLTPLGITSILDTPIVSQGKVVGVVCHEHVGSKRKWTAEEFDFASSIADLCAMELAETKRKLTEQALQQSQKNAEAAHNQLVVAIESLEDGFALYDTDDRLVICNSKYREQYDVSQDLLVPGVKFEEHIRASAYRGQQQGAIGREEEWVQKCVKQHRHARRPYLEQLGNGRWLRVLEQPTKDGGIVGVRTDITESKAVEDALRASEEKFRQITETIRDVFWMSSLDFSELHYISPAYEEIWGRSCQSLYENSRTWQEGIHPADREHVRAVLVENIDKGFNEPVFVNYRIVRPDGDIRWIASRAFAVRDDKGAPVQITGVSEDITKRKQAENELRESEKRFRRAIENAPIPIMIYTEDGAVLQTSKAWTALTGYSVEQITTLDAWTKLACGEKYKEIQRHIQKLFDLEQPVDEGEFEVLTAAGEKRIWRFSTAPLGRHSNGQRMLTSMVTDVTESKRAEEDLRRSEARFRQLAENLDQVFWFSSLHPERVVYASPAFEKIWGLPTKELYENPRLWTQAIHEDDRQRIQDVFTGWIEGREPEYHVEYRIVRPDGQVRWVLDQGASIRDEHDQIVSLSGIAKDITEEKQIHERMRFQSKILDSVHEAVVATDMEGVITYWGKGAARLYGYTPEEALGKDLSALTKSDGDLADFQRMSHALNTGSWAGQQELHHQDGVPFIVDTFISLVTNETGSPCGFIGIDRDITVREESLAKLRERDAELAHVSRLGLLGEMAAELSHEINQPLYAISNCAVACSKTIEQAAPDFAEKTMTCVREISEQAHRAGEIIRRISVFSRKTQFYLNAIQLNDLVRETVGLLNGEAKRRGVSVTIQTAEPLPNVLADRIQIQQVIANLIRNACEAMEEVPRQMRKLLLTTSMSEESVLFSAKDLGIGVSSESTELVFEPFFSTKPTGVGMGLAISHRIIQEHGGKIWVAPNEGPGMTFHFILPTHEDAANHEQKTEPAKSPDDAPA